MSDPIEGLRPKTQMYLLEGYRRTPRRVAHDKSQSMWRALRSRRLIDKHGNLTGHGTEVAELLLGDGSVVPCFKCGGPVPTMYSIPIGDEMCRSCRIANAQYRQLDERETEGGGWSDWQYHGGYHE